MKIPYSQIFHAFRYNLARTLFALAGVVMGISSLVFIVGAIDASTLRAESVINKLGPDSVLVFGGQRFAVPRQRSQTLTLNDVKELSRIEGVMHLNYALFKRLDVKSGGETKKIMVVGTIENWMSSWDFFLHSGRPFSYEERLSGDKVCVIGLDLAELYFGNSDPIGKIILLRNTPFKIIGTYARRGKTPDGNSIDERVYLPISAYQKFIDNEYKYVAAIRFRVSDMTYYDRIVADAKEILLRVHPEDEFSLVTPTEIKKFLNMFSTGLTLFLGIASLTALIVSGFVLANIFAINVKVRQWEIGLRKALGASQKAIMKHFLTESLLLTFIGAIMGIGVGFLGIMVIFPFLELTPVYPIKAFFIGTLFSLFVGIISAWRPAREASLLDPQEALRSKV